MTSIEQVPASEWQSWVETKQATLLDVREPHEWSLGTLPDAVLISMGEIAARIDELPSSPLLVVCRSGARSDRVATFLMANGFEEVANMAGGMKALGMQD